MRKTAVVALAGGIGSGKSSIAASVAGRLGCRMASFGGYVREISAERGLEQTRAVLQGIGEELMARDPPGFVRNVLSRYGYQQSSCFVVEGVRHAEAVLALRELVKPQAVLLVYLNAPADERHARVVRRDGADGASLPVVETHSTEVQVGTVMARMADFAVDATLTPVQIVDEILRGLAERGYMP